MSDENAIDWLNDPVRVPDGAARQAAEAHQRRLTKPPGALGRLEEMAILLAALQGTARPAVEQIMITVFAADHGVAEEGVSAFPQAVTAEMVKNFAGGGAAISVLARSIDATLEVVNLGTAHPPGSLPGVTECGLGPGSANFVREAAMTGSQLAGALNAGRRAVGSAQRAGADLFVGGEMGIANTTAASALACVLLSAAPEQLAGPGTGLDPAGVRHKATVIQRALELHRPGIDSPLEALRRLGGFEIAALTGACLASAQMGVPLLVDGFISSVAALVAVRLRPEVGPWLLFSHTSAEPGHRQVLNDLEVRPLLDLGMRLGEGSGAAAAVPLLRLACRLHNEMATFAEASVSEKL